MVINDCFTIDVYSIVYLPSTYTETYDTQLKLDLDCILELFNGQIGENCYGPWMNNAETMMMNYGSVRGGFQLRGEIDKVDLGLRRTPRRKNWRVYVVDKDKNQPYTRFCVAHNLPEFLSRIYVEASVGQTRII